MAMSSKFIIDSMLPKYASQLINSHLNNYNNHNNSHNNQASNSTVSQNLNNNSEGSSLTGSEEEEPPTINKMYPFVSNHPTHTSYSTMPGFSGLDDKSCG
jgi:Antp family protein